MMKRTILIDFGAEDRSSEPAGPTKVIHPIDAIQFIATGQFYSQPINPVRDWYMCGEGEDDWLLERESGRVDLAAEILTHAVEAGRLRCVFVVKSGKKCEAMGPGDMPRLEVISADQFAGAEVTHSWDDGFSLSVVRKNDGAPDGEDVQWVENFLLLWDEVAQVSPHRLDEDASTEYAPPAPRPAPHRSFEAENRSMAAHGGGRPTKAAAAHAALTIKLLEATDAELENYTVEAASVELQGLLKNGGRNEPHLDTCRKAARLILREVKVHRETK